MNERIKYKMTEPMDDTILAVYKLLESRGEIMINTENMPFDVK